MTRTIPADLQKKALLLLAIDQLFELTIQADINADEPDVDELLDFLHTNDVGVPLAELVKLDFLELEHLNDKCQDAIMESWREANDLGLLDIYVAEGD